MDKPRVKPHEQRINFPGEDYTPDLPLPDIRLEHFAVLISRNVSKRGAVIQSFPLASPSSASFRASRILQDDKVRDRIAFLRRRICAATASETPQEIARAAFAGESVEPVLDGSNNDPKMLEQSNIVGAVEKRRLPPPSDLTPAELRRIIADHARAGNASALNAAIKLLDAQLSAPPQVADPAGLCAILFNGGGGGETLQHIVSRIVSVFGSSEIRAELDKIDAQNKEQIVRIQEDKDELNGQNQSETQSTLCDDGDGLAQGAQPSQPDQQPQAQADEAGPAAGAGGGEGGEDARTVEV